MRQCSKCGATSNDVDKFCRSCGSAMTESVVQQSREPLAAGAVPRSTIPSPPPLHSSASPPQASPALRVSAAAGGQSLGLPADVPLSLVGSGVLVFWSMLAIADIALGRDLAVFRAFRTGYRSAGLFGGFDSWWYEISTLMAPINPFVALLVVTGGVAISSIVLRQPELALIAAATAAANVVIFAATQAPIRFFRAGALVDIGLATVIPAVGVALILLDRHSAGASQHSVGARTPKAASIGGTTVASTGSPLALASHPRRIGAALIDGTLAYVVLIPAFLAAGALVGVGAMLIYYWCVIGIWQGSTGRSLGKMATGLILIDDSSGRPPGAGKGLGRVLLAQVLVILIIYPLLDAIWVLVDDRRRRITDKILGTRVATAPRP